MSSVPERLHLRLYSGPDSLPPLIYFPGLHGDWTLIGGFRQCLAQRLRFAEVTYPRTLSWSLEDYAAGLEEALFARGLQRGWLLGESFGSQLIWPLVARGRFLVEGIILAGGFVRHPMRWAAQVAERVCDGVSLTLLTRLMFGYAKVSRYRFRKFPDTRASIEEFIARRTELDRQAAKHRLRLVAQSDFCSTASALRIPLYGLTGLLDPIVPWIFVRRWLKKHCVALREYKIIGYADHNVLGTAPKASADQVVRWVAANHRARNSGMAIL